VQVSWDADRYADALGSRPSGQAEAFEQAILKRYPIDPQHKGRFIADPCIIHDRNGKILFWYLPDALTPDERVRLVTGNLFIDSIFFKQIYIWKCLLKLNRAFQGTVGGPESPWRTNSLYFKDPAECLPPPGNINLSPAWFQQAHEVTNAVCLSHLQYILMCYHRLLTTAWKFQRHSSLQLRSPMRPVRRCLVGSMVWSHHPL
jgi:hypothetical protein